MNQNFLKTAMYYEKIIYSLDEMMTWSQSLARQLMCGDVVGLVGQLGSGKTTFTQGLYAGLGGDPDYIVTSPTFTLIQEYPIELGRLHHVDLYRLNCMEETKGLDLEEYLLPEGITVIEWADRFAGLYSRCSWWIEIAIISAHERSCRIEQRNQWSAKP